MKPLIAILSICCAGPALAGCHSFVDGTLDLTPVPVARICYENVCDITTQDYVCANVNSYQAGYAIGWTVDCTIHDTENQTCRIAWQGREIDPAKHDRLTITELDQ